MGKVAVLFYGIFAYIVALIGQIWFIIYLTQWDVILYSIYSPQSMGLWSAVAVNVGLVTLFGLQHSGMARKWFKTHLTAYIPTSMERSTYVLLSGLVFVLICLFWQPVDGMVWDVRNEAMRIVLWAGFLGGWVFSLVATFVINHFELFGLQQVYLNLLSKTAPQVTFQEKFFYRFVRHPIQLGVLLGLWITPTMTWGHLLLSLLFSLYIFIGLYLEEKDLVEELGEAYINYKKRVNMMWPKRRR